MRGLVTCFAVLLGACGGGEVSTAPSAPPAAPESVVCAAARLRVFGEGPSCVETPQPDLETAAGKVVRLVDANDPLVEVYYALIGPDGAVDELGSGLELEGAIDEKLHYRSQPDLLPAWQRATLLLLGQSRVARVRCRDATDVLPGGAPCRAASVSVVDGVNVTEAIVDVFPHPDDPMASERMIGRAVWRSRANDTALESSLESLAWPEPADAWPPDVPRRGPLPPPSRVAKPVEADAETSRAVCEHVVAHAKDSAYGFVRGTWAPCKAFHYPSLDLEDVKHYFVQGSGGNRPIVVRRKGAEMSAVSPAWNEQEFLTQERTLLAAPGAVAAETLLGLHMLYTDAPDVVRCRAASGDALPRGAACPPPALSIADGKIRLTAITEARLAPARGPVSMRFKPVVDGLQLSITRFDFDAQTWRSMGSESQGLP